MVNLQRYLPLIMAMDQNPIAPIKEIADIVDLSWPTTKKRIEQAKNQNLIYHPIGHFSYLKLGLHRYFMLATVKDFEALQLLEEICAQHPYTLYRSRSVGNQTQLFMMFQVPNTNSADNHIKDLFIILSRKHLISDYELYSSTGMGTSTKYDLQKYNVDTNKWDFDVEAWLDSLATVEKRTPKLPPVLDLNNLDHETLFILGLMNKDLSKTQKQMMDEFNSVFKPISKSEFNRRYNYLLDELIYDVELIYDYTVFDISSLYLYILPNLTQPEITKFFGLMESNPPPVKLSVEAVGQNTMLFWGNMNNYMARMLGFNLWQRYPQTQMFTLSNYAGWSMRYLFYYKNFDTQTKRWKDDYEYMVDQPLEGIVDK